MVRAKFRLDSIEIAIWNKFVPKEGGGFEPVPAEMRTLKFSPVYSDDPESENKRFWDATPSGSVTLGCVNQAAWERFELGKEYYLDFLSASS